MYSSFSGSLRSFCHCLYNPELTKYSEIPQFKTTPEVVTALEMSQDSNMFVLTPKYPDLHCFDQGAQNYIYRKILCITIFVYVIDQCDVFAKSNIKYHENVLYIFTPDYARKCYSIKSFKQAHIQVWTGSLTIDKCCL